MSSLQFFCGSLPMSYLMDQHRLLFWKRTMTSDNTAYVGPLHTWQGGGGWLCVWRRCACGVPRWRWGHGVVLVCRPCSRHLGPVDRCIGHLTGVGWPVQWSVRLGRCGWRAGAVPRSWRRRGASGVRRCCARGRPPWLCYMWGGSTCAVLCFYVCIDVFFCILYVF